MRWPSMHEGQVGKVAAACGYLERDLGWLEVDRAQRPDIGDIALATALSWVEFRRVYDFVRGRPRLARWYAALCARPSMLATKLEGQTHD